MPQAWSRRPDRWPNCPRAASSARRPCAGRVATSRWATALWLWRYAGRRALGGEKKFNVWGSYVVPENADRASGRQHAIAVYRGDEDVIAGPRSGADKRRSAAALSDRDATARDQILLVAAESDLEARQWTLSLMAAAGRRGVGLLEGEDSHNTAAGCTIRTAGPRGGISGPSSIDRNYRKERRGPRRRFASGR